MQILLTLLLIAIVLTLAGFIFGPYIIEAAVDKIDEWAEIIDAFKEEK